MKTVACRESIGLGSFPRENQPSCFYFAEKVSQRFQTDLAFGYPIDKGNYLNQAPASVCLYIDSFQAGNGRLCRVAVTDLWGVRRTGYHCQGSEVFSRMRIVALHIMRSATSNVPRREHVRKEGPKIYLKEN